MHGIELVKPPVLSFDSPCDDILSAVASGFLAFRPAAAASLFSEKERLLVRTTFGLVRRVDLEELRCIKSYNELVETTAEWFTKTPYLNCCDIRFPWSIEPLVAYATLLMAEPDSD